MNLDPKCKFGFVEDHQWCGIGEFLSGTIVEPSTQRRGFYRDACNKLAMLRQVEGTSVSIRHGSELWEKMDDIIQTFSVLKESLATVGDVITELQSRDLDKPDFRDQVCGQPNEDSKRGKKIYENRTKVVFRRLRRERFAAGRRTMDADFDVSAWEAHNAMQAHVQHDVSRRGSASGVERIVSALNDQNVRMFFRMG